MSYTINKIKLAPNEQITGTIHSTNIHYFILEGKCDIATIYNNSKMNITVETFHSYDITKDIWVEITNNNNIDCVILEIKFD